MDKLLYAVITAFVAFISLDTLRRLYVDRHRFAKEDLNDYDLAFVWRIVIFLIYPLLNLASLWVCIIACQWAGGYVRSMSYGLLWYQVIPDELSNRLYLIPTLFAGELAQISLALLFLVALAFRPHPFLAMLITYTCSFILAINLIIIPLLSLLGLGSSYWLLAFQEGTKQELSLLTLAHLVSGILFSFLITNSFVQKIFAELIRPVAMDNLKKAIAEQAANNTADDLLSSCNLVVLYEAAGLSTQANKKLKKIKAKHGKELLACFVDAYMSYKRRNFKQALKLFLNLANSNWALSDQLRSMFFAAAACATHATRDMATTINLVNRALEFDYDNSIARMLKIDIYLKEGKEDKAIDEFQSSVLATLDQSFEQSIPIEWQKAISLICDVDTCNKENFDFSKSPKQGPSPL